MGRNQEKDAVEMADMREREIMKNSLWQTMAL